ncbi:MAG: response regulator [Bacteroidota bacterium]
MESPIRIMIVEDEPLMAAKIEMYVENMGYEVFAVVDNSEDALRQLEAAQPDLILMDVFIQGDFDGVELTDLIHQTWPLPVIFISSQHDDNTFRRITRTNPVGFITKPFSEIQLKRSIELALQQMEQQAPLSFDLSEGEGIHKEEKKDILFVKNQKKLEKIRISEIYYLEADGRYCRIQLMDRKFLIRMSLKEMADRLQLDNFIQTHRSFIVNIDKIKSVDLQDNLVVLENMCVPISRREKENIINKLDWV